MFNKIVHIVKKIILSVLLIYGYNRLAIPLNVIIPINVVTILIVSICGIPSILMLVLFSLICI
jgi:hypothetical protein